MKKNLNLSLLCVFLLSGVFGVAKYVVAFTDVDDSHPYSEAILDFKDEGKIQGYEDGTFRPDTTIARGEFLKVLFEANPSLEAEENTNCFPDVKDEWFAKYVCTAKEMGIVNGGGDGLFHPEDEIIFAEAAKIILAFQYDYFSKDSLQDDPWYKDYLSNLSGRKVVPPSIRDAHHKVTRGEMVEIIWRKDNYDRFRKSSLFVLWNDATYTLMIDLGNPYHWKDGIVRYYSIDMPEADLDSFIYLGEGYARDKNYVYYRGETFELPGVEMDSFEVLGNHYFRDADTVYYKDKKTLINPTTVEVFKSNLPNASLLCSLCPFARDKESLYFAGKFIPIDLVSFEFLEYKYIRDKNGVYYQKFDHEDNITIEKIETADINTFQLLNAGYAKGKDAVYYYGEELTDADSDTFIVFSWSHGKDANAVYFQEHKISEDVDFFKLIGIGQDSFSKDSQFVYYGANIISDADPETFELIEIEGISPQLYTKDKNHVYFLSGYDERQGDIGTITILPELDSETFEVLGHGYTKDTNAVYYINERIIGVDSETFEVLGYGYTKDTNAVYYTNERIIGVDSETFEVLGYGYIKDANAVYYNLYTNEIKEVIGADPTTFEPLDWELAKDKNYEYKRGERISQ